MMNVKCVCSLLLLASILITGCHGPETRKAHRVKEPQGEVEHAGRVSYAHPPSPYQPELVIDFSRRTAVFLTRVNDMDQLLARRPIAAKILSSEGTSIEFEPAIYASGGLGRMRQHWYLIGSLPDRLEELVSTTSGTKSVSCLLTFDDGSFQVELLQRRDAKEE